MNINTKVNVALGLTLIAIVIAVGGYFFPQIQNVLGASTPGTRYPHGITVGNAANSPTNIADIKVGTGALIVGTQTQSASTTAPYDIAVSGVVSGDLVSSALFATTTGNGAFGGSGQWIIIGGKASSTSGFITLTVFNNTGGTSNLGISGIASSTVYTVVKTQ